MLGDAHIGAESGLWDQTQVCDADARRRLPRLVLPEPAGSALACYHDGSSLSGQGARHLPGAKASTAVRVICTVVEAAPRCCGQRSVRLDEVEYPRPDLDFGMDPRLGASVVGHQVTS
jgi:hypothetical protein